MNEKDKDLVNPLNLLRRDRIWTSLFIWMVSVATGFTAMKIVGPLWFGLLVSTPLPIWYGWRCASEDYDERERRDDEPDEGSC